METKTKKTIWNEKLWGEFSGRDGLKDSRAQAWSRFQETGFPDLKSESWRYTSTAPVAAAEFVLPGPPKPSIELIAHMQAGMQPFKHCARLIFINGWFMPQISDLKPLGESVDFASVKELALHRPTVINLRAEESAGFSAMNAALFQDGVWLNVRDGAKAEVPLLIYFLRDNGSSDTTIQLRHWITMGKNSSLTVLEWHDSLNQGQAFLNHEFQLDLNESSALNHYRFQNCGSAEWLRSASQIHLAAKSGYNRVDFECGSKVSRNELSVAAGGAEARCVLKGIGAGADSQHYDTQVLMDHAVPEASSDQSYRNLLGGKARGVFGGCVKVRPQAQKTDAQQVHKTLLISKEARADTKPQLEIDADDVKCSHGAAIGRLNEDNLFYLQSRGIGRALAERMLAAGFADHLLETVEEESWKKLMHDKLHEKLDRLFRS